MLVSVPPELVRVAPLPMVTPPVALSVSAPPLMLIVPLVMLSAAPIVRAPLAPISSV